MQKEQYKSAIGSRMAKLFAVMALGLFAAGVGYGQAQGRETAPQSVLNPNYKIGPGDVLDVVVSKNTDLSRTGLRVSNEGTIQLPMLDQDLMAACLTERQLVDAIKEQYRKYLVNPFINVSVREFNSNPVAVIGAVTTPGRFQLQRQIRLIELLTFVNGPAKNAGDTVEILRDSNRSRCEDSKFIASTGSGEELLTVSLADAFKNGDDANPMIFAGDIIRIPEADQVIAYIQGNVRSALAVSLKDPITLTQAIAMAGGTVSGAELEKIKIRRQIPGSINREEIVVSLKAINQRKRDDILLQANDIVEVPGVTGGKKFLKDLLTGFLPMVTRLPTSIIPIR